MDQATVERDLKKRAALYHDFQKRIVEASPIVFVMELNFVTIYNKKLQGWLVSPLGLYSAFDQAWLAK
jgi:peptide/nickel transport system substrate-binding protein